MFIHIAPLGKIHILAQLIACMPNINISLNGHTMCIYIVSVRMYTVHMSFRNHASIFTVILIQSKNKITYIITIYKFKEYLFTIFIVPAHCIYEGNETNISNCIKRIFEFIKIIM